MPQDIPPFGRAAGNPIRLLGLNVVAIERAGFPTMVREALHHAYRLLFNSRMSRAEALEELEETAVTVPEVAELMAFLEHSERGVATV